MTDYFVSKYWTSRQDHCFTCRNGFIGEVLIKKVMCNGDWRRYIC